MSNVLYVGDDQLCLDLINRTFGRANVRVASRLADAQNFLCRENFEIIVVDERSRSAGGKRLLKAAALINPGSCRVLLAKTTELADAFSDIGRGVIHFFLDARRIKTDLMAMLQRANAFLALSAGRDSGVTAKTANFLRCRV